MADPTLTFSSTVFEPVREGTLLSFRCMGCGLILPMINDEVWVGEARQMVTHSLECESKKRGCIG